METARWNKARCCVASPSRRAFLSSSIVSCLNLKMSLRPAGSKLLVTTVRQESTRKGPKRSNSWLRRSSGMNASYLLGVPGTAAIPASGSAMQVARTFRQSPETVRIPSPDSHFHKTAAGFHSWPSNALLAARASKLEPAVDSAEGEGDSVQKYDDERWRVKMLYDGECPLCMREVNFLSKRNEAYKTVKFVDIASPDFKAEDNAGISYEQAMGQIHGILRDGSVVTGIQAFRAFYEALGLGWVYAITRFPPVEAAADAVYGVWAKYRMELTGRESLDAIFEQRRLEKEGYKQCK